MKLEYCFGRGSVIVPLLILLWFGFTSKHVIAQENSPQSGTYVGSEKCAECHGEIASGLGKTPHGNQGFSERSEHGCETCHGPGSAHVESGDAAQIRLPSKLKPEESSAICLTCHENGMQANWKGSVHDNRGLACLTCHSIHQAKSEKFLLNVEVSSEACYPCHAQVKSQMQRTSHHPVREGLMTCASCHNPHGTDGSTKNLVTNSVNELCYKCHTEKRGPFLWEHPPVSENCLNCHTPHGSNNAKLLAEKRPYLCQRCHLDTRHPGTLYDSTTIQTSNREFTRSCSNCHLNIHGSNHPSGTFFLR